MFSIDRHNVPAKSRLYMLFCILYQVEILYSISPINVHTYIPEYCTVQCTYSICISEHCTVYPRIRANIKS